MELIKKHVLIAVQTYSTDNEKQLKLKTQNGPIQARNLANFWNYYARRFWDIQVKWILWPNDNVRLGIGNYGTAEIIAYFNAMTDAEKAAAGVLGFKPNIWGAWGGRSDAWSGLGRRGNRFIVFGNSRFPRHTFAHELGHTQDLKHANLVDQNGRVTKYADPFGVMGNTGYSFIAPNVVQLGFDTDQETKYISASQQVLMCPLELSHLDTHPEECQTVIMQLPGQLDTFVSQRDTMGAFGAVGINQKGRLFVHQRHPDGYSMLHDYLNPKPGQAVTLPNGVGLEYIDYDEANERARVDFVYQPSDTFPAAVKPTLDFPPPAGAVPVRAGHSGIYHDPFIDGQGITVLVKNKRLLLYWFTFDVAEGIQRFYWATGKALQAGKGFELLTTNQGSFEDPMKHQLINAGKARLYFTDEGHAVLSHRMAGQGRGGQELVAIENSSHRMNGAWFQKSRTGEGFIIQFFKGGLHCVAFLFTYGYGTAQQPFPTVKIRNQRWLYCQGKKTSLGVYKLDVLNVAGGAFLRFDEVTREPAGSIRLTIIDKNHIDAAYDIDAGQGTRGKGTWKLERLF